jgi:hypothetical protein
MKTGQTRVLFYFCTRFEFKGESIPVGCNAFKTQENLHGCYAPRTLSRAHDDPDKLIPSPRVLLGVAGGRWWHHHPTQRTTSKGTCGGASYAVRSSPGTTHAVDRGGSLHQINQTAGWACVLVGLPRATHVSHHRLGPLLSS